MMTSEGPQVPAVPEPPSSRAWHEFLTRIATNVWALRHKVAQLAPSAEADSLMVHIDAAHDALRQVGVEIQDYLPQPYHPGMNVEILVFQPQPGIDREMISATIRPAVYLRGQLINRGQVIVATPERKEEP